MYGFISLCSYLNENWLTQSVFLTKTLKKIIPIDAALWISEGLGIDILYKLVNLYNYILIHPNSVFGGMNTHPHCTYYTKLFAQTDHIFGRFTQIV